MQYAIKLLWEINEDLQPEIFSMFLISEGAGVGKGFVCSSCNNRILESFKIS